MGPPIHPQCVAPSARETTDDNVVSTTVPATFFATYNAANGSTVEDQQVQPNSIVTLGIKVDKVLR